MLLTGNLTVEPSTATNNRPERVTAGCLARWQHDTGLFRSSRPRLAPRWKPRFTNHLQTTWNLAIVGAGPVGLSLALQAARSLPQACIHLFDARLATASVRSDPRVLALSLGSVQCLQRLQAWPAQEAEPITQVHISQQPPTLATPWGQPELMLQHDTLGVPLLGAVLGYGALVASLQAAWQSLAAAAPHRLHSHWGRAVSALEPAPLGVHLRTAPAAGGADRPATALEPAYDLVVVAEGGLFGEQAARPLRRDYGQTAWIGEVQLEGATRGRAIERFTRSGPLALLPLSPPSPLQPTQESRSAADAAARASLVWCVSQADDPVPALDAAQRRAVLNTLLPASAGRVTAVGALKGLPLGLNAQTQPVQGRVVRIGNAAQTLHPVAGQGLNLGLRDAQTLLGALRQAEGRHDLDAVLRRVAWQRAPDRWATMATTDFLARSFTWQLPGAASLRGLGLAALQALPPLQRALARQMMFGLR
jgi:2-octaprenyl-6-methoxyphenol hydroxylase